MNNVDTLTGLRNRQGLADYLKDKSEEAASSKIWVALFDIDTFIYVNDQLGHLIGDKYLRELANVLTAVTHGDQLAVFRVSGDEFAVIGTSMTHARFECLMRKLQYSIHKKKLPFQCPDKTRDRVTVSVSIGEISFPEMTDPLGLLSELDAKLAEAKNELGRSYNAFLHGAR